MNDRINIITLVKQFEITDEQREEFLFTFRTFIKNISESTDSSINVMIRTLVKNEFEKFGGNQQVIVDKITEYCRSIIKSGKNKAFSNLLISLISNYLNALKFDPDKHVVLAYPENEFWDNMSADIIDDLTTLDIICKLYVNADDNGLTNTTVVVKKKEVSVESLKIKTINNYEKSIKAQKVTDYRNMLVAQCDDKGLKGTARTTYITEKLKAYKAKL